MADQNTTEVSEATASPKPEQAKAAEKKSPAAKKTAPKSKSAAAAPVAPVRKLRRYTPEERSSLLAAVSSETAAGNTLKDTLVKLNLSEQTYYNWKNDVQSKAKPAAAKATTKSAPAKGSKPTTAAAKAPASKSSSTKAPAAKAAVASDDLKALVSLEAENQRLRKSLAEKLRKENAELRKRLGLN
ncbi:transposase [Ochrobactrum quorumnocens]|uniref:Transcriptional regulator n=1 Tax=Ochrobactrum quorumnocens TaxID=271865 RepID=A0A5N1K4C7_9HYPH|nr:transposase [[Ochrobactrum] quorumnocens]KAA9368235.1 transcriptional regulator [[Ochrobactrum] quorumnocens]